MDAPKRKAVEIFSRSWPVFFVLLIAFLLRFWGAGFGLPYLYHADEPVVVNHALAYGTGDLNPHFFNIPPLISYLLFACYGIYYLIGRGIGLFHSLRDFETLFYADPSSFYWIARMIFGVMLGTASVYFLYRLGRRFWNSATGLWAAALLAVNFLHARDSHYIYVDIPLLFVMLIGFGFFFRIAERAAGARTTVQSPFLEHVFAGSLIGIAVATKYNGVFLAVPYLWITLRSRPWRKCLGAWVWSGSAAIITFAVLNPYAILDHSFFMKELAEQAATNRGGFPWFYHFNYSLVGAMGIFLLGVAVAAWIRGFLSKNLSAQALSVFVLVYYFVIYRWGQPYDRYALPLIPPLCVLTALFLVDLKDRWRPYGKKIFLAVIILCLLPSALKILCWNKIMAGKDIRTEAKEWIEENIPAGSRLALDRDFYMPRLSFTRGQLEEKLRLARESGKSAAKIRRLEALLAQTGRSAYELYFMNWDYGSPRYSFAEPQIPYDVDVFKKEKIDYVLVLDGQQPAGSTFVQDLERNSELVVAFTPYHNDNRVRLYDAQPLTGGPFRWADICARRKNGYPMTVYRLRS